MSDASSTDVNIEKPVVVGIGEVLWDVFPDGPRFGGAPANFVCHAQSLGAAGQMVSSVGSDELGHQAIDALKRNGVGVECVGFSSLPTGQVMVTLSNEGQPEYVIETDVAWDDLSVGSNHRDLASRCDAVCFGSLGQRADQSRDAIVEFVGLTHVECIRVFDVNLRQQFFSKTIVEHSLNMANVFKLSEEELPVVGGLLEVDVADRLHFFDTIFNKFDLRLIALTLGSKGSVLYSNGKTDERVAVGNVTCDTVGAGDAFTAGLVMGMLAQQLGGQIELRKVHRIAAKQAAIACRIQGGTPKS